MIVERRGDPQPMPESNSMILPSSHVLTGQRASIMPARLAEPIGARPIVDPEVVHTVGLVVPTREPMPLVAALVAEAKRITQTPDELRGRRGSVGFRRAY